MLKKIKILIFAILFLIVGFISMWYLNISIPCVYYELTGIYCPGCGMTRAFLSLLKLDFYQALRYNAFSIIVAVLLALYIFGAIYGWLFNKINFMEKKIPSLAWIIFIVALLVYGILRNIPLFSFLAPTVV